MNLLISGAQPSTIRAGCRDRQFCTVGAAAVAWPMIIQMNPSADVMAVAGIDVDLASIEPGQSVIATWRGKPVFIRNLTAVE